MKEVKTFEAKIYVGLRKGYDGEVQSIDRVKSVCQFYCDVVGLGVTVTPTEFIYTKGNEPGAIIGLMNYPRFHSTECEVLNHAMVIAKQLLKNLQQERCSIVTTDKTYLLEKE